MGQLSPWATPAEAPSLEPVSCKREAAAAQSLSRVPLCAPIDGSPPGSAVPGILQARTLEWVAISFSSKRSYHTTTREWPQLTIARVCTQQWGPSTGGKKSNRWEAVYKIVIPRFPVVSNTNILLSLIPPGSKWFTAVALCLAFSTPQHPCGSQLPTSICLYLKQSTIYLDIHVPRVRGDPLFLPSAPPSSEHPSTLLQYIDEFLQCSVPQEASRNNSIYLLQWLVEKRHEVSNAA